MKRLPVALANCAAPEQLPPGASVGIMHHVRLAGQVGHHRSAAHRLHLLAPILGSGGVRGTGELQHGWGGDVITVVNAVPISPCRAKPGQVTKPTTRIPPSVVKALCSRDGAVAACAQRGPYQA